MPLCPRWSWLALATTLAALSAAPAGAITPGQTDSFLNGSEDGWFSATPNPYSATAQIDGGPAGAGDGYLRISSDGGGGVGGKLVVFGGSNWWGDYLASGVTAIQMDVNNTGPTDLLLHLVLIETLVPNTNEVFAVTASPVAVPTQSGWRSVSFSLAPDALSGNLSALSHVTALRLIHSTSPQLRGVDVIAELGLDNVTAISAVTAVPEPASWGLMALGLAGVAARRPRNRPRPRQR